MTDILHTLTQLLALHRGEAAENCRPPIARPARDWLIIFTICLVFFVGLAALDVWLYVSLLGIEKGDSYTSVSSPTDLTKEKLQKALSVYDSYIEEHESLMKQAPSLTDPSQ